MGIFGALATAVSGLRAQSIALEHISDNIANSQTTGFKRAETSFVDIVSDTAPTQARSGVVVANSRATNDVQADIQSSDVDTHIAVNGDGYFIIALPTGFQDGNPIFNGEALYTRRGDFEIDSNGYLVNGAGYYLQAIPVDSETGNVSGTLPEVVRINNDFIAAQATDRIEYRANLSALPVTANYDATVPNSELINPAAFTTDPTTAGTGTIRADESSAFLQQSVAGGAITVFDSTGAPVNVQLRWAKTDSVANGGDDTWNLFYLSDSQASGATTQWVNVGQDYVFDAGGQLTPALPTVSIASLTVNGTNVGNVTLDHGINGLSQFSDPGGAVSVTNIDQNGFPSGELSNLAITDSGRISGTYSNGQTLDLAEVTLAAFNADGLLRKLDGGALQQTRDSGAPLLGASGRVVSQALEGSNADVADEFTKLIVTQQAYAAGTRIVTTSDELLQEALNMIR